MSDVALDRLNEASARLWRISDLQAGLQEMLAATIEILDAQAGDIQVYDPVTGVLRVAARRGEDPGGGSSAHSASIVGRDGALLGVIATSWRRSHQPSDQDLRRLALYLRQAADFIERCRSEEALRDRERRYHTLFETIDEGFCIIEFLDGPHGPLSDYVHVEANPAYARHAGIPNVVGQRLREMVPGEADSWIARYRPVLETGQPIRFEQELVATGRRLDLAAFRVEPPERRQVAVLFADITARWRAETALRESEAQLKAADRRKDQFLAMLAHELRNPLAPIRNAVQILNRIGPAEARAAWALDVIERQAQHLTRLIDDLLDVSRITQGKVTLQRELLELSTVLDGAVEASRPLIDARRPTLTVTLAPEPLELEGDLTRLVQVVSNLLNNAAKYTDDGGGIWIEAGRSASGTEAVVWVRDNGMGLTADLMPHVFDLFTQAERTVDRSLGGLGVGLTLVRELVEMHGGRVDALSNGPGHGSEFVVYLPLAKARAANARPADREARPQASAATLRVLVVEDNVDSAEMLTFMLQLSGHDARMAHDGTTAIYVARALQPHVILCDIGLPRMSGYEVAARLRQDPLFQGTVLIALTGYGQEDDRARALEAGFDHHVIKPVDPDALTALLATADGSALPPRSTRESQPRS